MSVLTRHGEDSADDEVNQAGEKRCANPRLSI
jgi:hypothetical protein